MQRHKYSHLYIVFEREQKTRRNCHGEEYLQKACELYCHIMGARLQNFEWLIRNDLEMTKSDYPIRFIKKFEQINKSL